MKIIKKYKYQLTVILLIIIILGSIFIKQKLNKEKYQNISVVNNIEPIDKKETTIIEKEKCTVDIKGAVKNPGVYTVDCHNNIYDVIKIAGGLLETADTSVTNLAKEINNEMVIIIYTKEEVKNSNVVDTVVKVIEKECVCPNIKNDGCINDKLTETIGNSNDETSLININTASLEKLQTLPGIGESKAKAIIKYRESNGNFKSVEDIQNVEGIGTKLYEEIKIYITT